MSCGWPLWWSQSTSGVRRNNPSFPSSVSHDISYLIAAASTRVVKWGEGSIGRITWRFVEVLCISCCKCHQTFTCVNSWRSHEEEHWNEVIKMIELKEKSSVQKTKPDETCFKIPKLTTNKQENPSKDTNEVNISDLLVQQILMTWILVLKKQFPDDLIFSTW